MRFFWFFLTLLTISAWELPAWAGQLVFWEFNDQSRQLQFRTDERVQPQAQLIPDPSRLVIDLPGTVLGRSTGNRSYGGKFTSVRLGQFTPDMARLVIELAPGYTLDPSAIKFEGRSPTNWTVDLPEPQRIATGNTSSIPNNTSNANNTPPIVLDEPVTAADAEVQEGFLNGQIRVTQSGLLIGLDQIPEGKITSELKGDRLEFTLKNLQLPQSLVNQTVTLNRYQVQQIEFKQPNQKEARISLKLDRNSPKWRALYSSYGGNGLVLIPEGGTNNLQSRNVVSPVQPTQAVNPRPAQPTQAVNPRPVQSPQVVEPLPAQVVDSRLKLTVVESIDLANNATSLLLRGDDRLRANGSWNRNEGVYQIRIENATLAQPVRGPQLGADSPVAKISMRQETESTVLVKIEPAVGVQIGNLNQPGDRLLSLELNRLRAANPPQNNNPVFVPPAQGVTPSTNTNTNTTPNYNVPQGSVLVMIDPGHGGKDPGAVGIGGLQEKNVILPISQEVAKILQQNGVSVRLTRDTDYFVSLEGRADMANNADADVFVSIHANAISMSRPEVNGLEVYYFQSGKKLAETIHSNILNRVQVRDRGVRTARFYVLRNTSMPSVLVEVGFVTGREDAPNLSSSAYRSQMAQAIASGILEYIQNNIQ